MQIHGQWDNYQSFVSAMSGGSTFQKLNDLLDQATACNPDNLPAVTDMAQRIANLQMAYDGIGAAFSVAGLFFAPESFGLSVALDAGVNHLLNGTMDANINRLLDQLTSSIEYDCQHQNPLSPPVHPPSAQPTWVFDPSGYVYAGLPANRLTGVTTTILASDTPTGPWTVWNAADFGEVNPETTSIDGAYGWDVPQGYWKVMYTAPGYHDAFSAVFKVLPPRTDVNIDLVLLAAPKVAFVRATSGNASAITITFDRLMRALRPSKPEGSRSTMPTATRSWATRARSAARPTRLGTRSPECSGSCRASR